MKCTVCGDDVERIPGIIHHLRNINEFDEWQAMAMLIDMVDKLWYAIGILELDMTKLKDRDGS